MKTEHLVIAIGVLKTIADDIRIENESSEKDFSTMIAAMSLLDMELRSAAKQIVKEVKP